MMDVFDQLTLILIGVAVTVCYVEFDQIKKIVKNRLHLIS